MPNGMLSDLEFENQMNELGDNQIALIKFIARQQFASSKVLTIHEAKIVTLENGDRKTSGIVGGISATIVSVIIGVINYFVTTNRR